MHATTVESLEIIFREYGSSESPKPTTAQVDFNQDSAHTKARLWKPPVNSELNAKIEMILLLHSALSGSAQPATASKDWPAS
jgi:hypothetical protein